MIQISVILPTVNRASLLKKTLDSLLIQTLPLSQFEVIVVDNGSTDNTKEIVDSFKNKFKILKYIYDDRPGLHVGRHRGMEAALSELLVFGDDDIVAMPIWLETILKCFEDVNVSLVGGKNLPEFEMNPPPWIEKRWALNKTGERILSELSILDLGDEVKEISPYYVFGCNFSIRRSVLLEAEGFHPDGMPSKFIKFRGDGETHVSHYILTKGYKIMYHPNASVFHFVSKQRMTKKYFIRRSTNQAYSDSYTALRKNGFSLPPKSTLRYLLRNDPWKSRLSYVSVFYLQYWRYWIDRSFREWIHRKNYIENPTIPNFKRQVV